MNTRLAFATIAMLAGIAPAAFASGVFNMLVENDVFTGTDRHYTNGLMLNYVSGIEDGPRRLRRYGVRFPGIDDDDQLHVSWSLGHEIYTPSDIEIAEPQPDERPYAGHVYLAAGFSSHNRKEIETWRVSLGLVGPGARAEYIQNNVHNEIDVDEAAGWDNQLENEVVLSAAYEKKWLTLRWQSPDAWAMEADFIPHVSAIIGTPVTNASLGGVLRVGKRLGQDHGPPRVRPSMPLSQFYDGETTGWYLFAGIDGRWVGHSVFLDGNTFESSPSVDRRNFVADLQAGFVLNTKRFRIGYTYIVRGREFEGQDERDIFGSLSLSWRF